MDEKRTYRDFDFIQLSVESGRTLSEAKAEKRRIDAHMKRWQRIHNGVREAMVAEGVPKDTAAKSQAGFADAWESADEIAKAAEGLAKGMDIQQRVHDIAFHLGQLEDNLTWLRQRVDVAYRHFYGSGWETRRDQIETVEYWLETDLTIPASRRGPLAEAMVDARIASRRSRDGLSALQLLGASKPTRGKLRARLLKNAERMEVAARQLRQRAKVLG